MAMENEDSKKDQPVQIRTREGDSKQGLLSASLVEIGGQAHILYVFQSKEISQPPVA